MIASTARRVGRLHVRGPSEEDARHASTLLADALHTASLPVADTGRLIVIRRLALGEISAGASSAAMALHLERAMEDAMAQATVYDVATAPHANAVVFPGRAEAIVALARLHAQRAPIDAWFWPRVVEGWRGDLSRGERWLLLLDAAHDLVEAPVVASLVVATAVRAGAEDELLGSMPPGRGATWLAREGWSLAAPARFSAPSLVIPRPSALDRWQGQWAADDDRLVWLTTLLALHESPTRAARHELPSSVGAALRESRRVSGVPVPRPPADRVPPCVVHGEDESPPLAPWSEPDGESSFDMPRPSIPSSTSAPPQVESALAPEARPAEPTGAGRAHVPPSRRAEPIDHVEHADAPAPASDIDLEPFTTSVLTGDITPCAGLLFVVPVLTRLGFGGVMRSSADVLRAEFPNRLFAFIGQRLGVRPDDPLTAAFPWLRGEDAVDPRLLQWQALVGRWCRRHGRFGLEVLVRRRGRVHISRSHIDVCFDLSQVDVRLRRLALDIDPGWVPWLGRVVRFHYLQDSSCLPPA